MRIIFSILLVTLVAFATPAQAQKKKKKGKDAEMSKDPKKDGEKSIAEVTKNCVAYEGLFTVYQDTTNGSTYLAVTPEQLDKEFIYFSYVEDGVLDAGFFRGSYRGSKIISFQKHYDRIEILEENTAYHYDEESPLHRASKANINTPILASEKIEAQKKDSIYLISGDGIFMSEKFQMVKPPSNPERPGMLGKMSSEKSKVTKIQSYPQNTDIRVAYVYDNPSPKSGGSGAVTDARYISVEYQHSLIAMPENNFKARRDDARVGYFMTQVTDMTSFSATPYRDVIHRWNLEKQNPGAKVSDPVEPITWWIENTTPVEFRDIIKEGVERWNMAYEKAGFSNAVVVKVQPDDADWDAGDIRYNVLRWTSSPQPPFGGYGPSFVNPRTGEILGADIMLEFSSISNRLFREEVFALAGTNLELEENNLTKEDMIADMHRCDAGQGMHHNMLFGISAMRAMNMELAAQKDFVKQTLSRLVLHEVGHTLGLMHNMRASTLLSPEDIKNKAIVDEKGLCNSVMEYPSINFALNKEEQTKYYDDNPGPYDYWVIDYGYSESLADPEQEEARLEKILSKSNNPDLAFGNDADDMRSSGKGIDPDVNIYDLSNDPVAYAVERCELVNKVMPQIKDEYSKDGETYHELHNAYMILTGEYGNQIRVMTRQIGGVHFQRSLHGQESETKPYTPVSEADQKAAMKALAKYAFAPDAFSVPDEIFNYLQRQRRGFDHFSANDDPRIHDRILAIQVGCLSHLLHPNVLKRITDSQMYGNTYDLGSYMDDLTDAIFKADLRTNVNSTRQNLQIEYTERLTAMLSSKAKFDHISVSMALYELDRIDKMMKSASSLSVLTKAHRAHVIQMIKDAKDANSRS
jgi:hypothetical protein